MVNLRTADRIVEVLTEKYHYKVSCNQMGNHFLELTIMDNFCDEKIVIIELFIAIDKYNVTLKAGYHQLNRKDKRILDDLILDFSNNPVLPHLSNYVKMPRQTVFHNWKNYLDACILVDKNKDIYLVNDSYCQVDKYGYIHKLKSFNHKQAKSN